MSTRQVLGAKKATRIGDRERERKKEIERERKKKREKERGRRTGKKAKEVTRVRPDETSVQEAYFWGSFFLLPPFLSLFLSLSLSILLFLSIILSLFLFSEMCATHSVSFL